LAVACPSLLRLPSLLLIAKHLSSSSMTMVFATFKHAVLLLIFQVDSFHVLQPLPGSTLKLLTERASYPGGWAISPDDAAVTCPSDASIKCGSSGYTSCCPTGQTCFGITNGRYCCPTGNRFLPQSFRSIANESSMSRGGLQHTHEGSPAKLRKFILEHV
jgi:hypothetical protein